MIYDSVTKCDNDIRRELFNSVIVTGGNTLLAGFHERLVNELPEVAPQQLPYKVKVRIIIIEHLCRQINLWHRCSPHPTQQSESLVCG